MHLTLIYPPLYTRSPRLPPGQGASQNIGLGYLSAYLKKHGHGTTVINALNLGIARSTHAPYENQDLYRIGLPLEEIVSRIPHDTDYIGLSIPFTNSFPVVKDLAALIHAQLPAKKIIMGGMHASAFPEQCLRAGADMVIAGEGERPLVEIAQGAPPRQIGGVYLLHQGSVTAGGDRMVVEDIDELPFPERTEEDIEICATYPPRGGAYQKTISLVTSRGCPFDCRFCSIHPVYGRRWRARSAGNVLAEIRHWYTAHGVRHFEFEDDNLTLNRDRAMKIFDGLCTHFPDISWAAHNGVRIDTLDEELLRLVKRSGCQQLNLAIESGNTTVLERMNKKLSLEKVAEVVRICGKLDIKAAGFLLVGYPGETGKSFGETITFFKRLKRLGLYAAIPLIINAYPGTQLYDECREKGYLAEGTDRHIFVEDDDFVSVTTPDFDRNTVLRWKQRAEQEINGGVWKAIKGVIKGVLRRE